ncbi:MAG: hypothetical protein JW768_11400 [Chitinispirillaceae bacterium]|nr:hypothetical protein [Chitinispirillaceae bacterium]
MRSLIVLFLPASGIIITVVCMCQPFDPITPPRLSAPEATVIRLSEARLFSSYREAIHLEWEPPVNDSAGIRSYSIIRKTSSDSVFDLFTRSQGIPPSIDSFNDDIKPIGFPNEGFTLVEYRIFAIDTLGRSGDTSAICSLFLVRQPQLDTIDLPRSSFRWHSRFIQGSIATYLHLWNRDGSVTWSSPRQEDFGSWDYPLYFSATVADSLLPLTAGSWYYAIYLFAMGNDRQSLKVDSFNVN